MNVEREAAALLLEEVISKMRRSVHPKGCDSGRDGDDYEGIKLHERICKHVEEINNAMDRWEKVLRYYNSVKDKQN